MVTTGYKHQCNRCGRLRSVGDLVRTHTGAWYCFHSWVPGEQTCYEFVVALRGYIEGKGVDSQHGTRDS